MKKIGIMGGTFNPIHNAHLMMAQAAYEQYGLDEVWFMPSRVPPHKKQEEIVPEEHRRRMVRLAADGLGPFVFSDIELTRQGTTYTSETLKHCVKQFPGARFYFIMGGDSLCDFDRWHQPQEIARSCTVLAVPRDGMPEEELGLRCRELSEKYGGEFLPVSMPQLTISSGQIRALLAKGQSAVGYLPEKVLRYIEIHGLYGAERKTKISKEKEIISYLEATLRPRRFLHTLGVAYTAGNLALRYGNETEGKRARLAGLLHDCAKYLTDGEMFALCGQYGIPLSDIERENPALIHGKLGACLAKRRFDVEDEEICSAIFYHTTGRPGMTFLEKILYIADYIEPGREMDAKPYSLSKIRKQCFRDLDKGLLMILTNTVEYLMTAKGNSCIDDMTQQTYEYYSRKDKKNGKSSK